MTCWRVEEACVYFYVHTVYILSDIMSPYIDRDLLIILVFPSLPLVHLFLEGHLHLEDPGDPIETSPFNKNLYQVFQVALEYMRYSSDVSQVLQAVMEMIEGGGMQN